MGTALATIRFEDHLMEVGTTVRPWIGFGAGLLAITLLSACGHKVPRQTAIMENSGSVSLSAVQLRAGVNELAERFAGRLEATVDRIRSETPDPGVRRRALAFKVDSVPAVYMAAYRIDPLTAAADLWALAFQIAQYVEDGRGRDAFGSEQPLAQQCARDLIADADTVVRDAVTGPEAFTRARARIEGWVRDHPIEQTLSSRPSVAAFMVRLQSEERDLFTELGLVSDTIANLSERLNAYAAQLPKQARWQAELLVSEFASEHAVEGTLDDIRTVVATARTANDLLSGVPDFFRDTGSFIRDTAATERRAALGEVDRQRARTLEYLTSEREAVLAALREERIAVVSALRQDRSEAFREAEAIEGRTARAFARGLRDLIDYTLLRLALLLIVLTASATAFGVIGYRLTVKR